MFDQINGLPVHALVLHAAVVFVPLLGVCAIAYALFARWRPRLGWAVVLLALAAPVATFVARESGEKLYERLVSQGLKGKGLEILSDHMYFGSQTMWFTIALGAVSLLVVAITWRRQGRRLPVLLELVVALAMLALAGAAGYYVYLTGDTGAHAVWGQY